jgi:hypothetical protein
VGLQQMPTRMRCSGTHHSGLQVLHLVPGHPLHPNCALATVGWPPVG